MISFSRVRLSRLLRSVLVSLVAVFSILVIVAVADDRAVLTLLHLLTSLLVITAISSPRLLIITLLIILLTLLLRFLILTLAVLPRDRGVNEVFVYLRYRG